VGKVRAEGYGECAVRVLYGGGMKLGEGAVLCQVDELNFPGQIRI